MVKYLHTLLVLLALCLFSITLQAQSAGKKSKKKSKVAVVVGATSVADYQDTFKLNPINAHEVKKVTNAKLQDSVTITILLDGTKDGRRLTINSNEAFDELFSSGKLEQTEGWVNPSKEFSKSFTKSKGYKVEIKFKHRKEVFYGILEFNMVYKDCAGDPSARSYFIRIPYYYVTNALGGNISVVYEYYECAPRLGDKTVRDYTTKTSRYTSWVLWLSDISFVE